MKEMVNLFSCNKFLLEKYVQINIFWSGQLNQCFINDSNYYVIFVPIQQWFDCIITELV